MSWVEHNPEDIGCRCPECVRELRALEESFAPFMDALCEGTEVAAPLKDQLIQLAAFFAFMERRQITMAAETVIEEIIQREREPWRG